MPTTEISDIKAFYEQYHCRRPRKADAWMQQEYWANFRGRILEIGAGTLYPPGGTYFAADLTLTAGLNAREQGIPAMIADGSKLPFSANTFDTIACYDVLEHVLDPERFLAEMCRVSKDIVIVVGPNYVGAHNGALDRYLPLRIWEFLFGGGRGFTMVENPHLTFDDVWEPDHDAVCKPNAGFVADQLKSHGLRIQTLRTWEHAFPVLNKFPLLRCLGQFMLVVGVK